MNPCNCTPNVFSIYSGNQKTITLQAVYEGTFNPVDLTQASEIVLHLPLALGGYLDLKLSLSQVVVQSPPNLGIFSALISIVNSALLNVGTLQDILATITITGDAANSPFTVRFAECFSVFA